MSDPHLLIARTDQRLTLTLNRPDKANALTRAMLQDLSDAVAAAREPVVVITGAGRVFSAGADLDAARAGLATDPIWEELSSRVAAYPGLTIAALNGTAAGGALGMVLACDLRVAVPGTKFFYPVMKLGFLPQRSDPARMRALVGPARTKQVFMAGARIDADTALNWGLIDRLSADLPDELDKLSADATAASAEHVAGIKALC